MCFIFELIKFVNEHIVITTINIHKMFFWALDMIVLTTVTRRGKERERHTGKISQGERFGDQNNESETLFSP